MAGSNRCGVEQSGSSSGS